MPMTAPTSSGMYREDWALVNSRGINIPVGQSTTVSVSYRVGDPTMSDSAALLSQRVPVGQKYAPGETFTQTFTVRNTGTTRWSSYQASYVGASATAGNLSSDGSVNRFVPDTDAGLTATVTIPMTAPPNPGTYISEWQLTNGAGARFGPILSTQIIVGDASSPITLTSTESYDRSTGQLALRAVARDNTQQTISTGTLTWKLVDASGAMVSAGNLYSTGASWGANAVLSLSPGAYIISYHLAMADGRKADATAPFNVAPQFSVEGRVTDSRTRRPLAGATVAIGAKNGQTDSSGNYLLENLTPSDGTAVNVTKTGYVDSTQSISSAFNLVRIVRDVQLVPVASLSKPVITSVVAEGGTVFLFGFPINRRFTVTVNWNGKPGHVSVLQNGLPTKDLSVDQLRVADPVSFSLLFDYTIRSAHTLRIIATNSDGQQSDPYDKTYYSINLPKGFDKFRLNVSINDTPTDTQYRVDTYIAGPEDKIKIPLLGEAGATFSANGHFDYRSSNGAWNVAIGAGDTYDEQIVKLKAFMASVQAQPGRVRFFIGNTEVTGEFLLNASGTASATNPITVDKLSGKASIKGNIDAGKYGLLDIWPPLGGFIRNLPLGIGPSIIDNLPNLELSVVVGLDGTVYVRINPDIALQSIAVEGTLGLEGQANATILGAGLIVDLGGSVTLALQYPNTPLFRGARLQSDGGFEVKVPFVGSYKPPFSLAKCWDLGAGCPPDSPQTDSTSFQAQPVNRDYLRVGGMRVGPFVDLPSPPRRANQLAQRPQTASRANQTTGDTISTVLAGSVYPDSTTALAARDNELMLLFLGDSGSPNPIQYSDVYWSYFDGTSWTTPAAIRSDPRAEYTPTVRFDGNGDAIPVWERLKNPLLSVPDPQVLSQVEMVSSRWDRTTRNWTEPEALTSNDYLDHGPQLAGPLGDGSLLLVWISNRGNLLVGTGVSGADTTDTVMFARWNPATKSWSVPQPLLTGMADMGSLSLAAGGSKGLLSWSRRHDPAGTPNKARDIYIMSWDGNIWSAPRLAIADGSTNDNIRALVSASGDATLICQRDGALVISRDLGTTWQVVRPRSDTIGFSDYTATASPSGNVLVLWQRAGQSGSGTWSRVFDPASGTWSQDIPLFNSPDLQKSLSAVWDADQNMSLSFLRLIPGRAGNAATADLEVLKRRLVRDLSINPNGFTAHADVFLPGNPVNIEATIRNTGDLAVQNPTVAFYIGDPNVSGTEVGRDTMTGWLNAGDTHTFNAAFTIPVSAGSALLYAVIDPDQRIDEFSRTNNIQSLRLLGPDLALSLDSAQSEQDGSARIVVTVRNSGMPGTPTASLKVRRSDNSALIVQSQIAALDPGAVGQAALQLPAGTVPDQGLAVAVIVDEEQITGNVSLNNILNVRLGSPQPLSQVAEPVFSRNSGSYPLGDYIRMTCETPGAIIRYTTDGSDPDEDDLALPSGQ